MDGNEIKARIQRNNARIEELLEPATFVLNREVADLISQNQELRNKCPHIFEKGVCIYCGAAEKS